jgi:dihydroxyacetone kinase-like protein
MRSDYIIRLLKEMQDIMCKNKNYLIDLDGVAGDGDLGLTMSDGFTAAYKAVSSSEETDCGKLLYEAGKAMSAAVPSTMGTLMASGLMQAGKVLKGKTKLDFHDISELFAAYCEGVANRGKAKVGEKTFIDGLTPAVQSLKESEESGISIEEASHLAYGAARKGFYETTTMIAVHGRAAIRGAMSRDLEDPGAAVAMLMMKAFESSFEE